MSKKTKEQDVQIIEATIHQHHRGANLLIALGPDRRLYRFQYPKNSIYADWFEGMFVRVYFSTNPLEPLVQAMEEV